MLDFLGILGFVFVWSFDIIWGWSWERYVSFFLFFVESGFCLKLFVVRFVFCREVGRERIIRV